MSDDDSYCRCESTNNNNGSTNSSSCQEAFDKCYNDHFNNPMEDYIPPHAPPPKRKKSSDNSVLETGTANNNAQEAGAAAIAEESRDQNSALSQNALDTEAHNNVKEGQEGFLEIHYSERGPIGTISETTNVTMSYTDAQKAGTAALAEESNYQNSTSSENVLATETRNVKEGQEGFLEIHYSEREPLGSISETTNVTMSYTNAPSREEIDNQSSSTAMSEKSKSKSLSFAPSLEKATGKQRKSLIPVRKTSTPADSGIRDLYSPKNPRTLFSSSTVPPRGSLSRGTLVHGTIPTEQTDQLVASPMKEKALSKSLSSLPASERVEERSVDNLQSGRSSEKFIPLPHPLKPGKRSIIKYPHDLWWWHPIGIEIEIDDDVEPVAPPAIVKSATSQTSEKGSRKSSVDKLNDIMSRWRMEPKPIQLDSRTSTAPHVSPEPKQTSESDTAVDGWGSDDGPQSHVDMKSSSAQTLPTLTTTPRSYIRPTSPVKGVPESFPRSEDSATSTRSSLVEDIDDLPRNYSPAMPSQTDTSETSPRGNVFSAEPQDDLFLNDNLGRFDSTEPQTGFPVSDTQTDIIPENLNSSQREGLIYESDGFYPNSDLSKYSDTQGRGYSGILDEEQGKDPYQHPFSPPTTVDEETQSETSLVQDTGDDLQSSSPKYKNFSERENAPASNIPTSALFSGEPQNDSFLESPRANLNGMEPTETGFGFRDSDSQTDLIPAQIKSLRSEVELDSSRMDDRQSNSDIGSFPVQSDVERDLPKSNFLGEPPYGSLLQSPDNDVKRKGPIESLGGFQTSITQTDMPENSKSLRSGALIDDSGSDVDGSSSARTTKPTSPRSGVQYTSPRRDISATSPGSDAEEGSPQSDIIDFDNGPAYEHDPEQGPFSSFVPPKTGDSDAGRPETRTYISAVPIQPENEQLDEIIEKEYPEFGRSQDFQTKDPRFQQSPGNEEAWTAGNETPRAMSPYDSSLENSDIIQEKVFPEFGRQAPISTDKSPSGSPFSNDYKETRPDQVSNDFYPKSDLSKHSDTQGRGYPGILEEEQGKDPSQRPVSSPLTTVDEETQSETSLVQDLGDELQSSSPTKDDNFDERENPPASNIPTSAKDASPRRDISANSPGSGAEEGSPINKFLSHEPSLSPGREALGTSPGRDATNIPTRGDLLDALPKGAASSISSQTDIQESLSRNELWDIAPRSDFLGSSPITNVSATPSQVDADMGSPRSESLKTSPHGGKQDTVPRKDILSTSSRSDILGSPPRNEVVETSPKDDILGSSPRSDASDTSKKRDFKSEASDASPRSGIFESSPNSEAVDASPQRGLKSEDLTTEPVGKVQEALPGREVSPLASRDLIDSSPISEPYVSSPRSDTLGSSPRNEFVDTRSRHDLLGSSPRSGVSETSPRRGELEVLSRSIGSDTSLLEAGIDKGSPKSGPLGTSPGTDVQKASSTPSKYNIREPSPGSEDSATSNASPGSTAKSPTSPFTDVPQNGSAILSPEDTLKRVESKQNHLDSRPLTPKTETKPMPGKSSPSEELLIDFSESDEQLNPSGASGSSAKPLSTGATPGSEPRATSPSRSLQETSPRDNLLSTTKSHVPGTSSAKTSPSPSPTTLPYVKKGGLPGHEDKFSDTTSSSPNEEPFSSFAPTKAGDFNEGRPETRPPPTYVSAVPIHPENEQMDKIIEKEYPEFGRSPDAQTKDPRSQQSQGNEEVRTGSNDTSDTYPRTEIMSPYDSSLENSDIIQEKLFPEFGRQAPISIDKSPIGSPLINNAKETQLDQAASNDSYPNSGSARNNQGQYIPGVPEERDQGSSQRPFSPLSSVDKDTSSEIIGLQDLHDNLQSLPLGNVDNSGLGTPTGSNDTNPKNPYTSNPSQKDGKAKPSSKEANKNVGKPISQAKPNVNDQKQVEGQSSSSKGSLPPQPKQNELVPTKSSSALSPSKNQANNANGEGKRASKSLQGSPKKASLPLSPGVTKSSNKLEEPSRKSDKVTRSIQTLKDDERERFAKQQASRPKSSPAAVSARKSRASMSRRRSSSQVGSNKKAQQQSKQNDNNEPPELALTSQVLQRKSSIGKPDGLKLPGKGSTQAGKLPSTTPQKPLSAMVLESSQAHPSDNLTPSQPSSLLSPQDQPNEGREIINEPLFGSTNQANSGFPTNEPSAYSSVAPSGGNASGENNKNATGPSRQTFHAPQDTNLLQNYSTQPLGTSSTTPAMGSGGGDDRKPERNDNLSKSPKPSHQAVQKSTSSTQTNEDEDDWQKRRLMNDHQGSVPIVKDSMGNLSQSSRWSTTSGSVEDANQFETIRSQLSNQGLPKTPLSGSGTKQKSDRHTQAPDDYNDPPIITPQPAHPPFVQPSARGTVKKGDRHTQAPDDFNDPPIITPQDAPSSLKVVNERKTIFNPRVMPAWAEEFLATRCGKITPFPYSPTSPSVMVGTAYANSHHGGGGALGRSYCEELLGKYMNPSDHEKDQSAPPQTPSKAGPQKSHVTFAEPPKVEEEEPGCCKCCCCLEWCCLYDSWIIWLIMLIAALMLVYLIWWRECGLEVLEFDQITDWDYFPSKPSFLDILGMEFFMQLFLSTLGYFAYFILICLCYVWCKKCAIPNDKRGFCSCKEIKLLIHMIYGVVLFVFLYLAVTPWKENNKKYGKMKNAKRVNHVYECLELCLWYTAIIFFAGIIVFLIYSLERRKIRKRIAPAPENPPPQTRSHAQQSTPSEHGRRPPPGAGQLPMLHSNHNHVSKSILMQSICADHVRPIFQTPLPPPTHTQSQFGFCDFSISATPYSVPRNYVNTPCSC